ncbi:MAG: hypothetical protein IT370_24775 [Deltaproteobacteria bacterium]|nr:hypothetical protein [Deltaproteobacteria bacterium]
MDSYNEAEFLAKVDAALQRVRMLLDTARSNPQLPTEVPHAYDDKYRLAEFLTRASAAALLQCLHSLGLASDDLARLRDWATTRTVTLRLRATEECTYLREETRKVESAHQHVTEVASGARKTTVTDKIVTTVVEHFWSFTFKWELVAFQGASDEHAVVLLSRAGLYEVMTSAKTTPRPRSVVRPAIDVDIAWLLRHIGADARADFSIDRASADCHTPRRNQDIERALQLFEAVSLWAIRVAGYFVEELFPVQTNHGLDLSALSAEEIFVPTVPLFEERAASSDGGVLPVAYLNDFLAEQQRSLAAKCAQLGKVFPRDLAIITVVEASLTVTLVHAARVCQQFSDGVTFIEEMLRKQLIAAIGKELTPVDFTRYMEFHSRKLLREAYRPQPFSHAVRRPEHDPEGVLSLEAQAGSAMADPVSTLMAWTPAARPMSFPLDASTRVSFMGDRYLHAYIPHQFSGTSGLALSLVARARQFSSFVLLVGRIASADVFEPRFGVIVQNKDLLKIPLMLEPIPTPKEFRDAIESLSPEQQRFAKAFRGMQLESTLFGVCVVQIKPQLEKLLKLDPDSLTKEIKLTQELLNLFLEYQIPSDLLSYDGPADAPGDSKLARVKEYVGRMQEMIQLSKQRQLEEEQQREAMRLAEMNRSQPVPSAPPPFMTGSPPGGPPGMPMPRMSVPSAPMGGAKGGAPPMMQKSMAPPPQPAPPPASAPASPPAPIPTTTTATATATATTPSASPTSSPPGSGDPGVPDDYTKLPAELDRKFEALDDDGALRPTIINPGDQWTRSSQKGLLTAPTLAMLRAKEQKDEKNRAFDLLDALTKSGALPIDHASLHVVLAATHCFDRTLVDTVIQGNVNPIEKVERSLLIVATTLHRRPAVDLLADDQRERFLTYSPRLGPATPPATPPDRP